MDFNTVIVADGTYKGEGNRDLDFGGKPIILKSQNGAESTIIDCEAMEADRHRGFRFGSGEGPDSVLNGFTITGGLMSNGGAIICGNNSSPTIKNCTITGNTAVNYHGGGIWSHSGANPTVIGCIITGNTAYRFGGGICCNESSVTIINCLIYGNTSFGYGGGVDCLWGSSATITNCTITDNLAQDYSGGGIDAFDNSNVIVTNSILWGNSAPNGNEISLREDSTLTISYCDVEGGEAQAYVSGGSTLTWGDGNIDHDPMFVDAASDDYHLLESSACIDVGDNDAPDLLTTDLDGDPRIMPGRTGLTADMGAYEFGPLPVVTGITRESEGRAGITWLGEPGVSYEVESSTDSLSALMGWTVEAVVLGDASWSTLWTDMDVPTAGEKYYRIKDVATGTYSSDIVGLCWISLHPGRNLVASPLVPYDGSLNVLIGGQLTGSTIKHFSDHVESWNEETTKYEWAYYDTTTEKWHDYETAGDPVFDIEPDKSYWINIQIWNPAPDLCVVGKVAKEQREIVIEPIRNPRGLCYPADGIELGESGLTESGFLGHSVKYWSDTVEWWNHGKGGYDTVYYDPDVSQWKDWDTEAQTSQTFSLGEGFWIIRVPFSDPYTWTVPMPYDWPGD